MEMSAVVKVLVHTEEMHLALLSDCFNLFLIMTLNFFVSVATGFIHDNYEQGWVFLLH